MKVFLKYCLCLLLLSNSLYSFANRQTNSDFSQILDTTTIVHLYYPTNDTILRTNYVYFKWEKMPNAINYHLQLAKDSLFTNIIQEDSVLEYYPVLINGLSWDTKFYWRIKAKYISQVTTSWTETGKFSIIPKVLDKLTLKIPANKQTNTEFLSTYFEWKKLPDATLYWLTLYEDSISNSTKKRFFTNTYFYNTDLKIDHKYFWCVAAYDYQTVIIDSSGFSEFNTADTIESPIIINKDTLVKIPFELKWYSTPTAKNYEVKVSKSIDFANSTISSQGINSPNYVISNLNSGEDYYAGVRAQNSGFYSKWAIYKFKTDGQSDIGYEENQPEIASIEIFNINGIKQCQAIENLPNGLYFIIENFINGKSKHSSIFKIR